MRYSKFLLLSCCQNSTNICLLLNLLYFRLLLSMSAAGKTFLTSWKLLWQMWYVVLLLIANIYICFHLIFFLLVMLTENKIFFHADLFLLPLILWCENYWAFMEAVNFAGAISFYPYMLYFHFFFSWSSSFFKVDQIHCPKHFPFTLDK